MYSDFNATGGFGGNTAALPPLAEAAYLLHPPLA